MWERGRGRKVGEREINSERKRGRGREEGQVEEPAKGIVNRLIHDWVIISVRDYPR